MAIIRQCERSLLIPLCAAGIGFSQSSGLEGYCSAGVSVTILVSSYNKHAG